MKKDVCAICLMAHFKNDDTTARQIARMILREFSLRWAFDDKNYWGFAKCKPCRLIEILEEAILNARVPVDEVRG